MKQKTKLKKMIPFVMGACLLTLVACGSDDDNDSNIQVQEQVQEEEGTYQVTLSPLNTNVAPTTSGTGNITIMGDEVKMDMAVSGSPAFTKHMQYIYTGTSCPTAASDTNADGYVDAIEASAQVGSMLIPLDGSIETQTSGMNSFPIASASGDYSWSESASLTLMMADLMAPDLDTADMLAKLNGGALNLTGRVVVIHGVTANTSIPATVQTAGTMPANSTLPIACGVITRTPN